MKGNSRFHELIAPTSSTCRYPHRFNELQKVKTGMGSPDWNVSMVDSHLRKLLRVYCLGHTGVKGNDPADTSGLLLGRSEVLKRLRYYLLLQGQGHLTIDRLEERVVERGSV